jgi:putative hydrolase of the HAD superfamily
MTLRTFQAILFDLDDTLYPEREYVFSGFRAVAAWAETRLGIPQAQGVKELIRLYQAGQRGRTFDVWLESHGKEQDAPVEHLVEVYREHVPTITPFPGAVELLDSLREHYRLGLVSDGYLAVQQRKLAALGLAHYFDTVVFSDAWGRAAWKPDPRPFKAILERLGGITPTLAIYVADNPEKDFVGARQLGIKTIRVCYPHGLYCDIAPKSDAYQADLDITTLHDVERALQVLEECL